MYKIKNITYKSTLTLNTFTLNPDETKIIEDQAYLENQVAIESMKRKGYIKVLPYKEVQISDTTGVTSSSTSTTKRGRKSKSKKENN